MAKFNVGDTVKVAKKIDYPFCAWTDEMSQHLGDVHKVVEVCEDHTYRLEGCQPWWFAEDSLEPAIDSNYFPQRYLQTGDIIINERGNWFMVMRTDSEHFTALHMSCSENNWDVGVMPWCSFSENLADPDRVEGYDVVKVLRQNDTSTVLNPYMTQKKVFEEYYTLWKRKEAKEYTIAQLEKLLGERIKIVKEEDDDE